MSHHFVSLLTRSELDRTVPFLLRLTIVASIIFFSAYIIPRVPFTLLLLMLVGLVGLGVSWLFLQKPELGLVVMIPACLAIPLEIGTGTGTGLNAGILLLFLLLGLGLLERFVRKQPLQLADSPALLPLLLFLVICVLAFIAGQLPWFTLPPAPLRAQIGGLSVFILSAGAFLLVAHQIRELRWLQWMTWLFLAWGMVYIPARIVPGWARIVSPLFSIGAVGSLFWVWLVALAFSQALINQKLGIAWRIALLLLVFATFYVAYGQNSDWKSGWIPPLVSVATILVARWWRLGVLASIASIVPAMNLLSSLIAADEYSYSTRLDAWIIVVEIVRRSPILGLGPANYYWYTPLFPIRGYAVEFNSHNQYIDLIAQTGIVGLLCFLWFVGVLGWLSWRLRTQVPTGFARAYVYGALGGLVGMLVAAALGDWVLPFVYNIGLTGMRSSLPGWMFLGGLVALERICSRAALSKSIQSITDKDESL